MVFREVFALYYSKLHEMASRYILILIHEGIPWIGLLFASRKS